MVYLCMKVLIVRGRVWNLESLELVSISRTVTLNSSVMYCLYNPIERRIIRTIPHTSFSKEIKEYLKSVDLDTFDVGEFKRNYIPDV